MAVAAAMELGGVVEGGLKLDASRWRDADGQKYTHSVLQHKIGETAEGQKYARSVLEHKIRSIRESGLLYGTYAEKRTRTKAHSTVGEEHKKYKYKNKNPP